MKVLVAMSGGVDSSVAAAEIRDAGHRVVGATMKLWGGESDAGCCSVSDVEDARRVAAQLGIDHHVFNFTDAFDGYVVDHYVEEHRRMRTPNPCIECNRHIKFGLLIDRARRLGFDAIATGHHARVTRGAGGRHELRRGVDRLKDQSYVLSMLGQSELSFAILPVGEMTKDDVRRKARLLGLRTADKPDSQDVCFIGSASGRSGFLADRIEVTPGRIFDADTGEDLGDVPALELVTIGQRRGIRPGVGGTRRYAVGIEPATRTVRAGTIENLLSTGVELEAVTWVDAPPPPGSRVEVQVSAHGIPLDARVTTWRHVVFDSPQRRVAPGQTVAFYDGDRVLGSAIAVGSVPWETG